MARAFKFLKNTSVNCGAVAEGNGVAADVTGGAAAAGEGFASG